MLQSRGRIEAATWVVRDTYVAEDIFQSVILKVMTKKEITFQAEEALLSWAFSLLAEKVLTGSSGMQGINRFGFQGSGIVRARMVE